MKPDSNAPRPSDGLETFSEPVVHIYGKGCGESPPVNDDSVQTIAEPLSTFHVRAKTGSAPECTATAKATQMETVPLLIGGQWRQGASGRWGDVYNPSTGQVIARVPLCSAEETGRVVEAAAAALPAWARDAGRRAGAGPVPLPRADRAALRRAGGPGHARARQDAAPRPGPRCSAASRWSSSPAASPACSWARRWPNIAAERRLRDDPASGRRLRRHHAVQLPGDGAAVDVPGRHRLRQHVRPEAVGEGAAVGGAARRAADRGGPAGGRVQHRARRQGVRRCAADASAGRGRSRSSARRRSPSYIYETGTKHGKRVQAAGGAKNHLIIMPDADLDQAVKALAGVGVRLRRRALHGRQRGGAGGRDRRSARRSALRQRRQDDGRPDRRRRRRRHGPGHHAASICDRVAGYLDIAEQEGADVALDGRARLRRRRLPARAQRASTASSRRCAWRGKRSSARCSRSCAPATSTKRWPSAGKCPYGNGASIFTRSGYAARQFKQHFNAGMIGINVGVPAPMAWFPFTGWNQSFFGDLHIQGTESVQFYTQQKMTMTRWFESAADSHDDPVWRSGGK